MSDATIKRALEVAAIAHCKARLGKGYNPCSAACDWCRDNSAAAIAAFLEAPPPAAATIRLYMGEVSAQGMRDIYAYHRWLAAAVRREAGGE